MWQGEGRLLLFTTGSRRVINILFMVSIAVLGEGLDIGRQKRSSLACFYRVNLYLRLRGEEGRTGRIRRIRTS